MKFRKRPIVIEAEQWERGKKIDGLIYDPILRAEPYIETLEGRMFVNVGDWIITGIEGERYCCKDEIFKMTYETVEEQ